MRVPLPCLSAAQRARFYALIDRSAGPDACHPWRGSLHPGGYGRIRFGSGSKLWAHRLAYFLATGEQPSVVRHACDNPPCCNERHLLGGTQAENIADREARGRTARGEHVAPRRALTAELVAVVRQRYRDGHRLRALARELGIAHSTLSYAINGKTWTHVR